MVQLSKSINERHHTNKMKNKNSMIISIDALDKIQYPFMIRTVNKLGTGETHLNIKPYMTNLS